MFHTFQHGEWRDQRPFKAWFAHTAGRAHGHAPCDPQNQPCSPQTPCSRCPPPAPHASGTPGTQCRLGPCMHGGGHSSQPTVEAWASPQVTLWTHVNFMDGDGHRGRSDPPWRVSDLSSYRTFCSPCNGRRAGGGESWAEVSVGGSKVRTSTMIGSFARSDTPRWARSAVQNSRSLVPVFCAVRRRPSCLMPRVTVYSSSKAWSHTARVLGESRRRSRTNGSLFGVVRPCARGWVRGWPLVAGGANACQSHRLHKLPVLSICKPEGRQSG